VAMWSIYFPRKISSRYDKFKKLAVFIDSHYLNYVGLLNTN